METSSSELSQVDDEIVVALMPNSAASGTTMDSSTNTDSNNTNQTTQGNQNKDSELNASPGASNGLGNVGGSNTTHNGAISTAPVAHVSPNTANKTMTENVPVNPAATIQSSQIQTSTGSVNATPTSAARGGAKTAFRGRGGRPRGASTRGGRGGKRKRSSNGIKLEGSDNEAFLSGSDSSEVYTPIATQTKSGRSITKPTTFVPPPSTTNHTAAVASPRGGGLAGGKRKRVARRNPEAAVCKMCLRGVSPASNMIVFCDGCNAAYHRYCHHPPIDQSVVDEVDKEWLCLLCEKEKLENWEEVRPVDVEGYVTLTTKLTEIERRRYFTTLSYGTLVSLLTRATGLQPNLPVYAPSFARTRVIKDAVTAGHAVQPPSLPSTDPESLRPIPLDHPPNYPRPGFGLMATLPPDREDESYLVDEEDRYGVFSHVYQTDAVAANGAVAPPNVKGARGKPSPAKKART